MSAGAPRHLAKITVGRGFRQQRSFARLCGHRHLFNGAARWRCMKTGPSRFRLARSNGQVCNLRGITREFTLSEFAIITRGAPARVLALTDRGHLGEGAVSDVAVYSDQADKTAMFASADLVFKDGELVVRDGLVVSVTWGRVFQVAPGFDTAIERWLARFYDRYYDVELSSFGVPGYIAARPGWFATVPCLH